MGMKMNKPTLHQQIARRNSDKNKIAESIIHDVTLLPELFSGLEAKDARTKYGSNKVLIIISEMNPSVLFPKFDFFVHNLDSENNFLKWGAIEILANLCKADARHKFENVFVKFFSPLQGHNMITAANTIKAVVKIADAKHNLAEKMAAEIIAVENADFETLECNNIVIGQAITALDKLFPRLRNKKPAFDFVHRHVKNSRPATRKKAETFLRRNKKLITK